MLSVYSAKAKQKVCVKCSRCAHWLGQTKEAGSQSCYYKNGIRVVAKIDTDICRTADAIFEQYHYHCSQNCILTVKKHSRMPNIVLSIEAFQYIPIA